MHCCIKITLTQVGESSASLSRVGGMINPSATLFGGMVSSASLVGNATCKMTHVCRGNVNAHYLDINPKVIWLLSCVGENEVHSNTNWKVD